MIDLLVIGAGGYGRSVAEAAIASGKYAVKGFIDDRWPQLDPIWDIPILGRVVDLPSLGERFRVAVVAIGNNAARRIIVDHALTAGLELATIIHPSAIVSARATIGKAVTIMARAVVGTEARVDDGAIVNAGAIVDHHAHVHAFAQLCVGSLMAGGANLGAAALLQEGLALGASHVVPAGTVVRRLSSNHS